MYTVRHDVVPKSEAERAGFEPATHLSARTRFPVALLRPLGHLSVPEAEKEGFEASINASRGAKPTGAQQSLDEALQQRIPKARKAHKRGGGAERLLGKVRPTKTAEREAG